MLTSEIRRSARFGRRSEDTSLRNSVVFNSRRQLKSSKTPNWQRKTPGWAATNGKSAGREADAFILEAESA